MLGYLWDTLLCGTELVVRVVSGRCSRFERSLVSFPGALCITKKPINHFWYGPFNKGYCRFLILYSTEVLKEVVFCIYNCVCVGFVFHIRLNGLFLIFNVNVLV